MSVIIIFFLSLSFIYSNNDEVLIKIDNKIITKNDFIKRAEYTIRPSYCRSDNYIHKKIILNSLIAEKLLALEIENRISVDQLNNDFLMGIKEQWMREIMLKDEIYNKIEIDSLSIHNDFVNSSKEYNIQYLSLNSDSISKQISYLLNDGLSFEDVSYNILKLNQIPERTISYFEENDPQIHAAIFSKNHKKGDIIGPIYSKDSKVLFVKIKNWKKNIILTDNAKQNQINAIKQKKYENKCIENYDAYVHKIMKSKKMEIFHNPFLKFTTDGYNKIFSKDSNKLKDIDFLDKEYGLNPKEELLLYNNRIYTVEELNSLIKKHPLVFRKDKIKSNEFANELKYAIADLLRDEELTNIAYNKNYDNHFAVQKEIEIFRDAMLSNLHFKIFLESKNISNIELQEDYTDIINSSFRGYLESIQQKYSSIIEIDFKLFDSIKLTHIDLYAYKKGLPYPSIVPSFPILTTNHEINYGVELNNLP